LARALALGLLVAAIPTAVVAQDIAPTPEQVTERSTGFLSLWNALRAGESGLRVRLEPALVSSAKYDGSRAWWYRTGASIEAGMPITENFNVGISPSFAFERLVVKGADDFIIGEDGRDSNISEFFDGSLNVGAKYDLNESWGAEFVLRGSARQESGADFEDSVQIGGSVAATYRRGKWLRVRLGLGVGSDLSDRKPRISPVYRIVFRPVPKLSLETSGLNGTASYDWTEKTSTSLSGGLDGTQYNLERRAQPPVGLGRGTLQRRQSYMTFGVTNRFRQWIRITAELGLVFKQELAVLDSEGTILDERNERTLSANGRLKFDFRF
jgi:hypothetical protein